MKSICKKLPARCAAPLAAAGDPAAWRSARLRRRRARPSRCAGPPGTRPTRWSSCRKDFTAKTKVNMKFEFVPWPNFADRMLNELNSQGQAVRPDHRRQPVDRRLGRERPLREAERLLRQGRHQDDRLRAGHRDRLCRVAEGHAELLGAAGDGRRARLDLSQGLVRQARAAGRVQEEAQPRPRGAQDLDRVQAGRRVLLRAARSTARRSTAPTSSPSAAPKASRWA